MSVFCCIPPNETAILSTLIAIALGEGLSAGEKEVLGNILLQVGQTLATIASQEHFCEENK